MITSDQTQKPNSQSVPIQNGTETVGQPHHQPKTTSLPNHPVPDSTERRKGSTFNVLKSCLPADDIFQEALNSNTKPNGRDNYYTVYKDIHIIRAVFYIGDVDERSQVHPDDTGLYHLRDFVVDKWGEFEENGYRNGMAFLKVAGFLDDHGNPSKWSLDNSYMHWFIHRNEKTGHRDEPVILITSKGQAAILDRLRFVKECNDYQTYYEQHPYEGNWYYSAS